MSRKVIEMTKASQAELLSGYPKPQSDYQVIPVTIRELCEQRDRFNISPEYQREDVWTLRQQQQLIDTILSGLGVGLLEGYKYQDVGKSMWEIMDGHQRISTIHRFYDGKFKTWTPGVKKRMQPVATRGPVEEGKFYSYLSAYAKDYFLDYRIQISKVPEMTLEERVSRFLTIQCHTGLTPAERLHVYPSQANSIANTIAQHSFWEDFYGGEIGRKQLYLSSLYLAALQMAPNGIVDLRAGLAIPMLASGKRDDKITDTLATTIQENLDIIACVYADTHFTDRAAIIAMYQSIMLLEQAGCKIKSSSHKVKLTKWMSSVIDASKHASGLPNYHQPIQKLLFASGQRAFWATHEKTVMNLMGVKSYSSVA